MNTQPTTPSQTPLTADAVFGDGPVVDAWGSWDETVPLIVRGHHTDRTELDQILADLAESEGSELQRVIPGAHTTTWVRFTTHQDWCSGAAPDDEALEDLREDCEECRSRTDAVPCDDCAAACCDCGDDYDREQWSIHPATADTPGAIPVTWARPYLADWTPDYSQPEHHEPYVTDLQAAGWFTNPVEGPHAATQSAEGDVKERPAA